MLCVCAACHDGRTVRVPWTLSPANCMPHRHLPGSSRPSACPSIYLPLCRFGHRSVRCQYGPTVWVQCVGWSVRACARPPVRSLVRPHAQHIALIVPQQLHTQPNAHLVFLNTTRRISTFILINRLDTHRAKCYSCTALMLTDATMDPEHRSYANTHQRQPPAQRANAPTNPPLARSPHHGDAPGCCPLRVSLFDAKPHHVEPTLMPPASGGPPAWTQSPATHQQPTSNPPANTSGATSNNSEHPQSRVSVEASMAAVGGFVAIANPSAATVAANRGSNHCSHRICHLPPARDLQSRLRSQSLSVSRVLSP